jgi:hypothetical protein
METLQLYVTAITCTVFIVVGTFGNIISIIIFRNKQFKKQHFSVYMICISILNIVRIYYIPIMMLASYWVINSLVCKITSGIEVLMVEIQAWIVALCSFDRCVTLLVPFKFKFKNKLQFQFGVMALIVILLFIFLLVPIYFYDTVKNQHNQTRCAFTSDPSFLWVLTYFKINFFLLRVIVPYSVMTISSSFIIWKTFRMKKKLSRKNDREIQLAKTLVALDFFFIVFRLPTLFYVLLNNNDDGILFNFLYSIFVAVASINNAFEFILLFALNKIYRELFLKCIKCNRQNELTMSK